MRLIADHISKTLKGRPILEDISLDLESGHIYGFVGPNACGKTMLFRALSGLIGLTAGQVSLDGKVLKKDFLVLPHMGILIENVSLFPNMTGLDNLAYLAKFQNKIGLPQMRRAMERVGLNPDDKRKYHKYSLGMKQKLAIAQAIMEEPDILLLDEPTNGLDFDSLEQVRQVLEEEKKRGALVLLASHNQGDMSRLADVVFEMSHGTIIGRRDQA